MKLFSSMSNTLSNSQRLLRRAVDPMLVFPAGRELSRVDLFHGSSSGPSRHYACNQGAAPVSREESKLKAVVKSSAMAEVQLILQHSFRNQGLLAESMIHRSIINTGKDSIPVGFECEEHGTVSVRPIHRNNERLEMLGDKVFGLLAAQALYEQNEEFSEGEISNLSQSLVSRKKALEYCKQLELDRYLVQADRLQGRLGSRYGDFFEALLGALFVDGGYQAAENFFRSKVVPTWNTTQLDSSEYCHKQALQEYLVRHGLLATALGSKLKYVTLNADFREQVFTQAIELFGRRVSTGTGPTRISADQAAAKRLHATLQRTKPTCLMIRMARQANDHEALVKLQAARAAQVKASESEVSCASAKNQTM